MLKVRKYSVLVATFLVLFPIVSNAQIERFTDPYFENYTTSDRLPFDNLNDAVIDEHGFLWISSIHGILRFDGYEFKKFRNHLGEDDALVNGSPKNIVFDRYGYLWIGATEGLSRLNVQTGEILNLMNDPKKFPLLGHECQNLITGEHGDIWMRSDQGLNRINVDNLEIDSWGLFKHHEQVSQITIEGKMSWDKKDKNILWIGSKYGLLKFNVLKESYEHFLSPFFIENAEKLNLTLDFHTFVHADSSGFIYTGSWGNNTGPSRNIGMHEFNPKDNSWRVIPLPETTNKSQSITSIQSKSETELWVGTAAKGLGIYNRITDEFTFIDHDEKDPKSIRHNIILFMCMDRMDNLIVGTENALSISYKQHSIFKYKELIPKDKGIAKPGFFITDILENDSLIMVATYVGGGLFVKDKIDDSYQVIPLSEENRHPFNAANRIIFDHKNDVYIASRNGLKVFNVKKRIIKDFETIHGEKLKLDNPILYSVIEDADSNLWVGSAADGLIRISAKRDGVQYFKHDPNDPESFIGNSQIRNINQDDEGRIWAASYNDGVSVYSPKVNTFENYSNMEVGKNYLETNFAYNTLTDTLGRNWISSNILYCIDETKVEKTIEKVTTKDGLPGSLIRRMKMHPDGTFWMVSNNGFVHFNPYDHAMEIFTTKEGIGTDQMWDDNFYFTDDGKIRLFAGLGYLEFQEDNFRELQLPGVAITELRVNGELFKGDTDLNSSDTLRFGYNDNYISLEYALMNFPPKPDNTYRYILEGFDDEWIEAEKKNYAEYRNLPGGYYIFRVNAKDRMGNESNNSVAKVIFIATPFWKTWWFKSLIALAFALLLYMIYRYRIATIQKEKSLKARLAENEMIALRAQMNPHFLFNTINSIKRFIIKNETTIAADHLTKFSRLVRLILNNSNSRVIPLKDEVEALRLYIEMEMMRFDDKFDYSISLDENLDLETLEIPPMLMQPYVENAIWHGLMHKVGGKGLLKVKLIRRNDYLECLIEDNGVGRAKAAEIKSKSAIKKKSLGMSLTQRRIDLLDQFSENKIINLELKDLTTHDGEALGTQVFIRIPIEKNNVPNHNQP